MKAKQLLIALAATMLLGAAMPAQAQKKKVKKAKPENTQIQITIPGELGMFDLRGPVKECKVVSGEETKVYGFDTNGMWTTEDGQSITEMYGNALHRDSKGRITMIGDVEENRKYQYNANGFVTKFEQQYMSGGYTVKYTYNSKGECIKTAEKGSDMGESFTSTSKYTILARDEQGNWTKRKSNHGFTETRTITYYE